MLDTVLGVPHLFYAKLKNNGFLQVMQLEPFHMGVLSGHPFMGYVSFLFCYSSLSKVAFPDS